MPRWLKADAPLGFCVILTNRCRVFTPLAINNPQQVQAIKMLRLRFSDLPIYLRASPADPSDEKSMPA